MKIVFSILFVSLVGLISACNVKDAAQEVGDAGNHVGKTIDDTINRDNVKKD